MSAMNYTRKRALLACDFCRHRKRKCDGGRPCSTCVESNADCVYKELPSDRVESTGSGAVLERLDRIEALLQTQGLRLDNLAENASSSRGSGTQSHSGFSFQPSPLSFPPLNSALQTTESSSSIVPNDTHLETAHFFVPLGHTASVSWLLNCAPVKVLLGDYPKDYFYTLEERLPPPQPFNRLPSAPGDWPDLDGANLERLVQNYFSEAHPHFPLFTIQDFEGWQANLFKLGPQNNSETAICMCVYAIGSLVSPDNTTTSPQEQAKKDALSLEFFHPAIHISLQHSTWAFRADLSIVRAVLLCASYLAHMGRPLHSWKLAYLTSTNFIQLLDKRRNDSLFSSNNDEYLRAFWSCFMIECDRAADFDVLRSGIEPMADKMPLPRSLYASETDDLIYFVAETAIRRLLNRILFALYDADNSVLLYPREKSPASYSTGPSKYLGISSELDRQLEEWYHSIPGKMRPPIGTGGIPSDRGKVLRLRYYAAKQLIHRQFVFYVALQQSPATSRGSTPGTPQPGPQTPRMVLDKCETCITSCTAYLRNALPMLDKRSPYLWNISQAALACLLVLTVAETSPQLRSLTPNVEAIGASLAARLRRWAVEGSSFAAVVSILESVDSIMAA